MSEEMEWSNRTPEEWATAHDAFCRWYEANGPDYEKIAVTGRWFAYLVWMAARGIEV